MGGNLPGFQMIKDRVIKPLIVASEKVVEYYFKDEGQPQIMVEGASDSQILEKPMAEEEDVDEYGKVVIPLDSVSVGTTGHLQRKFEQLHISNIIEQTKSEAPVEE